MFCFSSLVKSNLLLTSASKIEPMKALDSRFTERSKATPGVTAAISSTAGLTPLDRAKDGVLKDVKNKEETSSDSEDKMAAINKNLSFTKRKADLLMEGGEVVEKRKKGRPRKDKMATPISQPFTQLTPPSEKEPSRVAASPAAVAASTTDTQHKEGLQPAAHI
uniref:protein HIRA-like n=1 Tax=Centroberyx gerrardi TaxID=166262 RepID=UPI003AAA869E